ncbi:hypothetical protein LEP1GSC193_0923 [Leptospira alstonii serovar Pingchang str. 80-412]|uniref:Uncharacterized protein n=2 Tax=Leptospira alstonii TaxID=28452 RepID=M6DAB3_9LEPT|nr:hypothetical protein LEP1GSC194_3702 [Leptospira alstonii serovar Sichuan str. 79601]EQA80105.1 hypothetical protein LEP1GSC193_0923 [Leptospira alstonii serovar Pingchang str. 80-412]
MIHYEKILNSRNVFSFDLFTFLFDFNETGLSKKNSSQNFLIPKLSLVSVFSVSLLSSLYLTVAWKSGIQYRGAHI